MLLLPLLVQAEVKVSRFCRPQTSVFHSKASLIHLRKAQKHVEEWADRTSEAGMLISQEGVPTPWVRKDERGCDHTCQGWGAKQDGVVCWEDNFYVIERPDANLQEKRSGFARQLHTGNPGMLMHSSKTQLTDAVRTGKILWPICDLILHLTSNLCVWGICWFVFQDMQWKVTIKAVHFDLLIIQIKCMKC